MSSLQKFHRRTNNISAVVSPFTTIGSGSDTVGYWLGDISSDKLIVSPKSSEKNSVAWGSYGITRNTTDIINGLANTNTLYALGSAAHPAAYYCKTLTTGGYNTWYMPARNELITIASNKTATPFSSSGNGFVLSYYWATTEFTNNRAEIWIPAMAGAYIDNLAKNAGTSNTGVRAIRRTTI